MTCICLYPKLIYIDDNEFLALPTDEFPEFSLVTVPKIEYDDDNEWVIVIWDADFDTSFIKRYEVNNHIVYAGCGNGRDVCEKKDKIYVLHPVDEWEREHIININ